MHGATDDSARFYDKAYEWLAGQCFCKLEPAELMRLCSRLLAKESHLEEKAPDASVCTGCAEWKI